MWRGTLIRTNHKTITACDRFIAGKCHDRGQLHQGKALILQNPILFVLISFERPEIR